MSPTSYQAAPPRAKDSPGLISVDLGEVNGVCGRRIRVLGRPVAATVAGAGGARRSSMRPRVARVWLGVGVQGCSRGDQHGAPSNSQPVPSPLDRGAEEPDEEGREDRQFAYRGQQ